MNFFPALRLRLFRIKNDFNKHVVRQSDRWTDRLIRFVFESAIHFIHKSRKRGDSFQKMDNITIWIMGDVIGFSTSREKLDVLTATASVSDAETELGSAKCVLCCCTTPTPSEIYVGNRQTQYGRRCNSPSYDHSKSENSP